MTMRPDTRLRWILDTFSEQRRLHKGYGVGPTDLVLDVGSGQDPSPRANVLCDKFVADSTERHGQAMFADRPFVIADVEALPFADGAFDYAICSHVLEHVADPERATRELQRVARRGYVETPSASWEKVAGFPFHRWMVSVHDGRLVFEAKSRPIVDPELRQWFGSMQQELGIAERVWFGRRRAGVYTDLHWDGEIPVEVVGERTGDALFVSAEVGGADSEAPNAPTRSLGSRLIDAWGQRLRRQSAVPWPRVRQLLRCPACRGELNDVSGGGLSCSACGIGYETDATGRPVLLAV